MRFRLFVILAFVLVYASSFAQYASPKKWSILTGYEVNYTGNNAVVHGVYLPAARHTIEVGLSYNFSDGFATRHVIGLGVSYGYTIAEQGKWIAAIGVDYRRQKPLAIVNIQTITYTTRAQYQLNEKWSAYSRLGYGVAAERARSAGSFTQSNNITGSLSIGCVYQL